MYSFSVSFPHEHRYGGFYKWLLVLLGVVCCVGWVGLCVQPAFGVQIRLSQSVDGLSVFDTRDFSKQELEGLAAKLGGYWGELGSVEKIRRAITERDYYSEDSGDRIVTGRDHSKKPVQPLYKPVSVVAGTRWEGSRLDENNPKRTQLKNPDGVAVAVDGSMLITDTGNHRVLRVSWDGERIEVIAGTGKWGSDLDENDPKHTQLDSPEGVAVTPGGSILIADTGNHRVLLVAPDGRRMEVVAGTGQEGSDLDENSPKHTQLKWPGGVAVAANRSVLITDTGNHRVFRVTRDGQRIVVIAGTGTAGNRLGGWSHKNDPLCTQLDRPRGVAVGPDGSVLITDTGNHRVLRVSWDGERIEVIAGTGKLGSRLDENDPKRTQLNRPRGVAVTRGGSILITDTDNNRVLLVTPDGRRIEVIAGTGSKWGSNQWGSNQWGSNLDENDPKNTKLKSPWGVVVAAGGSILITDKWNHRVLRVEGMASSHFVDSDQRLVGMSTSDGSGKEREIVSRGFVVVGGALVDSWEGLSFPEPVYSDDWRVDGDGSKTAPVDSK